MRLCISGSRGYKNLAQVTNFIKRLDKDVRIVVGDAAGVDTEVVLAAKENDLLFEIHFADWKQFGKAAGPIRNKKMVCESDATVAFWDGSSPGTWNAIKTARRFGKLLMVFNERTGG